MSYSVHSVEDDQCVFLVHTSDLAEVELAAARVEAYGVLDQHQWKRLVVDVTRLHLVPTSLELLDYAKGLAACASRPVRVALVVRPEQQRPAKFFEKAARHGRVFVTYFVDHDHAVAWVKQTGARGPARRSNPPAEAGATHSPT